MPNKVDTRDFLYRKVNPGQYDDTGAALDAFEDSRGDLSFRLASLASPMDVLDFFASLRGVRTTFGDNITGIGLYERGYRIAIMAAQVVIDNDFTFRPDSKGDEYNSSSGHVNVTNGNIAAFAWRDSSRILTEEEMKQGILPLPPTPSDSSSSNP